MRRTIIAAAVALAIPVAAQAAPAVQPTAAAAGLSAYLAKTMPLDPDRGMTYYAACTSRTVRSLTCRVFTISAHSQLAPSMLATLNDSPGIPYIVTVGPRGALAFNRPVMREPIDPCQVSRSSAACAAQGGPLTDGFGD